MFLLTSYLHREALKKIISRAIADKLDPQDSEELKKIINFNSYICRIYLKMFTHELFSEIYHEEIKSFPVYTKGELKDFIIKSPRLKSIRTEQIIGHYKKYPQDYYRETPFKGRIYYYGEIESPNYIGSSRLKRNRRIAEKGSRRIIDYIFQQIKANADKLAEERAGRLGIPKSQLLTSIEEQVEEFKHAERRIIKAIRTGTIFDTIQIEINDVAGIKVIVEDNNVDKVLTALKNNPRVTILEDEIHRGRYNARNLIVDYQLDAEGLKQNPPNQSNFEALTARAIDSETLLRNYVEFIDTSESHVRLEIIVSNFQEMLESELGRCMHEERIIEQRKNQQYKGHLARNIEYVIEYLLAFAICPQVQITELPIKFWIKYMPDYIDNVIKDLYNIPSTSPLADGV